MFDRSSVALNDRQWRGRLFGDLIAHRPFADRLCDGTKLEHQADPRAMNALLIGYARVSTYEQDLTARRVARERLGVIPINIQTDHGLTGTNRSRPGLREALESFHEAGTHSVAELAALFGIGRATVQALVVARSTRPAYES